MTEGYHSMIFADTLDDIPFYNATNRNPKGTEGVSYRHSFDSWHMVPTSRPSIAIPTVKDNYIEIPGSNDSIDLTEALTGYPLYNMREGSQEFLVLNDYENWISIHDKLIRYLHGRSKIMILEDDISHYYIGRWKVNEWRSDKERSMVTLDYKLKAYKKECQSSDEEWLWDPFRFDTGIIRKDTSSLLIGDDDGLSAGQSSVSVKIIECDEPLSPEILVTKRFGTPTTEVSYKNIHGEDINKTLTFGKNVLYDMRVLDSELPLNLTCTGGSVMVTIRYTAGRL